MRSLLATSVLATALLVACATTSSGARPGEAPEAAGERIYREHCGSCHRLRGPAEQTGERWAWAVEKYGPRAHVAPADRPLVLTFLQAHAKDAAPASTESSR